MSGAHGLTLLGVQVGVDATDPKSTVYSYLWKVSDTDVKATATVDMTTYETDIDITYMRRAYTFHITKWRTRGLNTLLEVFHTATPRDATTYGTFDAATGAYAGTSDQKRNCVVASTMAVLECLSKIVIAQQKQVLDYAVWYREQKRPDVETFSTYITLITCHSIVHSEFTAGSVKLEKTEL